MGCFFFFGKEGGGRGGGGVEIVITPTMQCATLEISFLESVQF